MEFAADIEADIAKIEIGSEERARTTNKKFREKSNSLGGGRMRPGTSGHPPHQPHNGHPRSRAKGPATSLRSPRTVKTAPEVVKRGDKPIHDEFTETSKSVSAQSNATNFSEGTSDNTVRESLQGIKRIAVSSTML